MHITYYLALHHFIAIQPVDSRRVISSITICEYNDSQGGWEIGCFILWSTERKWHILARGTIRQIMHCMSDLSFPMVISVSQNGSGRRSLTNLMVIFAFFKFLHNSRIMSNETWYQWGCFVLEYPELIYLCLCICNSTLTSTRYDVVEACDLFRVQHHAIMLLYSLRDNPVKATLINAASCDYITLMC